MEHGTVTWRRRMRGLFEGSLAGAHLADRELWCLVLIGALLLFAPHV